MSSIGADLANYASALRRPQSVLWYTALLMTALGVIALGMHAWVIGLTAVTIGGGTLSLLSLTTELRIVFQENEDQFVKFSIVTTGAVVFATSVAIGLNIFQIPVQLPVRIVVLTLGLQALLLTVDVRPVGTAQRARIFLLMASHGAVFGGSLLVLPFGPRNQQAALLLYSVGFPFLVLHAFWMRRLRSGVSPPKPDTRRRHWESLILVAILIEIAATICFTIYTQGHLPHSPLATGFAVTAGLAGTVLLASLSVPRTPPGFLTVLTAPLGTIVQHVLTLMLLVNTLFFALFLAFPSTFTLITGGFLAVLAVGVIMNYVMLLRAHIQTPTESPPSDSLIDDTPLTVVVTAKNEANVLRETLRDNLKKLPSSEFLVVPAEASDDGTHEVLTEIREEYGDQIRIREGTAGSKAGDLNQIWTHIDTPFVLVLDADEQVSRNAVTHGLHTILSNQEIGIVQGRKVATYPDTTTLSKFTTVERQHSTWIDHPFVDSVLDAGHFAGSSAVLRRSVVSDVGNFATSALTEDIDLTIRMYLETDWELQYDSEMVFHEYNPGTWTSLIRQRERWGRGWAQSASRYFTRIIWNAQKLGWRRTTGLTWKLFLAVSSPVYTIFPAIIAYWIIYGGPPFAPWLMFTLTVVMLPERGISFLYAAFRDPALSRDKTFRQTLSTIAHAYLWLPFGWVIQLHSLYLQLAGAVERWDVTKKAIDSG